MASSSINLISGLIIVGVLIVRTLQTCFFEATFFTILYFHQNTRFPLKNLNIHSNKLNQDDLSHKMKFLAKQI